jgi:hypothetical protein
MIHQFPQGRLGLLGTGLAFSNIQQVKVLLTFFQLQSQYLKHFPGVGYDINYIRLH